VHVFERIFVVLARENIDIELRNIINESYSNFVDGNFNFAKAIDTLETNLCYFDGILQIKSPNGMIIYECEFDAI
jgi:hypothetical protein